MTSSGKVRIYELSKDLGLENKDVLDAAEKLSIAAKSHSSSISDSEAGKIRSLLGKGASPSQPTAPAAKPAPAKPAAGKSILSVKKAPASPGVTAPVAAAKPQAPAQPAASKPSQPSVKAVAPPARPAPMVARVCWRLVEPELAVLQQQQELLRLAKQGPF